MFVSQLLAQTLTPHWIKPIQVPDNARTKGDGSYKAFICAERSKGVAADHQMCCWVGFQVPLCARPGSGQCFLRLKGLGNQFVRALFQRFSGHHGWAGFRPVGGTVSGVIDSHGLWLTNGI